MKKRIVALLLFASLLGTPAAEAKTAIGSGNFVCVFTLFGGYCYYWPRPCTINIPGVFCW